MAADYSTKQSGPSPGNGLSKTALIAIATKIMADSTAANKITKSTFPVELPTGKNFVIVCLIPTKVLFFMGHTETTIAASLGALMDDNDKLWVPKRPSGATAPPEGISRLPNIVGSMRSSSKIGKRVTLVLNSRYPSTIPGGELGSVDGTATKRQGRQTILARIHSSVPLISVGILLYHLNSGAVSDTRKILLYTGPSQSNIYGVPGSADELAEYNNRLAKVIEVA